MSEFRSSLTRQCPCQSDKMTAFVHSCDFATPCAHLMTETWLHQLTFDLIDRTSLISIRCWADPNIRHSDSSPHSIALIMSIHSCRNKRCEECVEPSLKITARHGTCTWNVVLKDIVDGVVGRIFSSHAEKRLRWEVDIRVPERRSPFFIRSSISSARRKKEFQYHECLDDLVLYSPCCMDFLGTRGEKKKVTMPTR
jgi:hypothetical protein